MKKLLTAFILFQFLLLQVSGQDSLELDPVTITASLRPTRLSSTGRNLISFKGSDFQQLPIHSLDELLRYLPGLEIQSRGPMGAQSDIVLRGGTFQQVLVLLDGMRVNDPNTGHFNSYIPITPNEIERVEILKGASSAIYGADAVGGVVHVITKAFAAKRGKTGKEMILSSSVGEYGLFTAQAGGIIRGPKTLLSGGWLSNNTDGRDQRGTTSYVHANSISIGANHFFNDQWQLSLRSSFDDRRFGAQNYYTSFLSDTATESVRSTWNQARLQYRQNHHSIALDFGYKHVLDEYLYNKASIPNKNKSDLLQALLTDAWQLSQQTILTGGFQVLERRIRSNDRGDHTLWQTAAFITMNQRIGEHLSIDPALRIEHNERSGTELIPQLNVSYKPRQVQYRMSAGKTTREADFTERFNNYNKATVSSGRIGNPDLSAETSFSYEAGADYFGMKGLKISIGLFQRLQRRLIDYTPTLYANMPRKDNLVPGGSYALARNIAKVNTKGIELDWQYQRSLKAGVQLLAGGGFILLKSESSDTIPSFYISSHAKFLGNLFFTINSRRIQGSITGLYKQRAQQHASTINASISKDYFILNARAGYKLQRIPLQIFVQADNLLDQRYSDLLGARMPGSWLMAGISLQCVD